MITGATVNSLMPVDRLANASTSTPGSASFILAPHDLLEYARCPGRLRARIEPVEPPISGHANALRCLHLEPQLFTRRFRTRPETYQVSLLRCPTCNSASPSASCSRCGIRRRPVNEDRPWNGNAAPCRAWSAIAERDQVEVISKDTQAEAQHALERLEDLPDVASLRRANSGPLYLHFQWQDPVSSVTVPLLFKVDYAPDLDSDWGRALGSFRVVADASPNAWARSAFYRGEHMIAALTLDAWNSATDDDRNRYLHVLSEASAPHEPGRRELAPDLLAVGRTAYSRILSQYCASLAAPCWPGYDYATSTETRWTPLAIEPWMDVEGRSLFGAPAQLTPASPTHEHAA